MPIPARGKRKRLAGRKTGRGLFPILRERPERTGIVKSAKIPDLGVCNATLLFALACSCYIYPIECRDASDLFWFVLRNALFPLHLAVA